MSDCSIVEGSQETAEPSSLFSDEKYEVVSILSKGKKSIVYLARNFRGNPVAIKELFPPDLSTIPPEYHTSLFDNDGVSVWSKEEIEAGMELIHPHIVRLENSFTKKIDGNVHTYIVMEYIDGKLLDTFQRGDLSIIEAKNCAIELIDALLYSARKGWVHRDLYSENIMITKEHTLKLIDLESFSRLEKRDLFETNEDGYLDDSLREYLKGILRTIDIILNHGKISLLSSLLKTLDNPHLDQNVSIEHQDMIINVLEKAYCVILEKLK